MLPIRVSAFLAVGIAAAVGIASGTANATDNVLWCDVCNINNCYPTTGVSGAFVNTQIAEFADASPHILMGYSSSPGGNQVYYLKSASTGSWLYGGSSLTMDLYFQTTSGNPYGSSFTVRRTSTTFTSSGCGYAYNVQALEYGSHKLHVQGGDGPDSFYGGDGPDELLGLNGNDQLRGYGGNDRLVGSYGNDTIYGGDGNDWIYDFGTDTGNVMYGENGSDCIQKIYATTSDCGVGTDDFVDGGSSYTSCEIAVDTCSGWGGW